jgi:hypothetical protein
MLLRRVTGVLTAVLMLHLSVVASDVVCATHMTAAHVDVGARQTHHAEASTDMGADMANQTGLEQHHGEHPCDTPVQPNCCQALASCGSVFAATNSPSRAPAIGRERIARAVTDMPASELVAPDTPPPKA